MAITTSMIKELRDATSMGIADCKKALEQTDGDFDAAVKILREKGAAVAAKRASKEATFPPPVGCWWRWAAAPPGPPPRSCPERGFPSAKRSCSAAM